MQEHAAVMNSVRKVLEVVKQGDVAEGHRLAAALADWFPGHAFHLDFTCQSQNPATSSLWAVT